MQTTDTTLEGQRIGFFGRGGSGKSTCTVLLARALAQAGYAVCVLDADSTNEGLAQALGADRTPEPLLEWLGGTVFSGGRVTCPVDDPTPLADARLDLDRLPREYIGQTPDGILVFTAGKMGLLGPGAGCDGPVTKIARDFALEPPGAKPITLIDFKAGVEDTSRGVITSLDWLIVVVDASHAALQMAVTMERLLDQMRAGHPPATEHLTSPELAELVRQAYRTARLKDAGYIINRVSNPDTEQFLWQRLVEAGISPLGVIREDPTLQRAWLQNHPLESTSAQAEAAKIVKALERLARDSYAQREPAQRQSTVA